MKMMMLLGLMFVWSIQPYLMIISLMMLTLGYSIYMYYSMGSFWYGYMLILVMMSGILVLFTYISSMIPNESFEYMILVYLSLSICMIMFVGMMYNMFFYLDNSMMILKFWKMIMSLYNIYLICLLLMIMVMVVWLSSFDSIAVRNF